MGSDLSDHGCFASTHLASGRACPHFLNKHRGSPAKRNKKLSKARAGTHEMQQLPKIPCLIFCYFAISSSWTIPAKANPILDLLGHYGGNILLVCPGNYHQAIAPRATRHGIIGISINVPSGGWLCNFISLLPLVGGGGSSDRAIQATWETWLPAPLSSSGYGNFRLNLPHHRLQHLPHSVSQFAASMLYRYLSGRVCSSAVRP